MDRCMKCGKMTSYKYFCKACRVLDISFITITCDGWVGKVEPKLDELRGILRKWLDKNGFKTASIDVTN